MYGYIYMTTNLLNGKRYIGQHRAKKFTETYKGSGKILKLAIEKSGEENFKVELLECCESKEELNEKEQYWIKKFNAQESKEFYNICKGGEAGPGGPNMKGKHHSEETKRKMSEARKGSLNSNYGNHRKMNSMELKRHKELRKGENNPMYGKHHSDETKRKISEAHKVENLSDETRKRISQGQLGKTKSKEAKLKLSKAFLGRKWVTNGLQDRFETSEICEVLVNQGFHYGRSKYSKCSSETIENTTNKKDVR